MGSRVQVLCVGHDKLLLETRRLVLKRHYSVETAATLEALTRSGAGEHVALVVLCHSLSRQERLLAAEIVKATWPRARVLEILATRENHAEVENSAALYGLDGPAALLEKAASLIETPPISDTVTLERTRKPAIHGQ